MKRQNLTSGSPWEDKIGYCRAVKVGNIIEISGTTASELDPAVAKNNYYEQTKFIIKKLEGVLGQMGAGLKDVVRTRMFVADISRWEEVASAHGEFFKDIKPATTIVEAKLIDPNLVIEIEMSAVIQD